MTFSFTKNWIFHIQNSTKFRFFAIRDWEFFTPKIEFWSFGLTSFGVLGIEKSSKLADKKSLNFFQLSHFEMRTWNNCWYFLTPIFDSKWLTMRINNNLNFFLWQYMTITFFKKNLYIYIIGYFILRSPLLHFYHSWIRSTCVNKVCMNFWWWILAAVIFMTFM